MNLETLVVIALVLSICVAEALYTLRLGYRSYDLSETIITLIALIQKGILGGVGSIIILSVSRSVWEYRLFDIQISNMWSVLILALIVEFVYYASHRFQHTVRLGWNTHMVHHSVKYLNIFSSFRTSWTTLFSLVWCLQLPVVWIGFPPEAYTFGLGIIVLYQTWLHTELIPRIKYFDFVFNSPANHRVHHATNPLYIDKNLGGVTMIFDHIFRTYQAEISDVKCSYGLVKPLEHSNPFIVPFSGWITMMNELKESQFKYWLWIIFKRPGWTSDN